jgi:hypothetical protein
MRKVPAKPEINEHRAAERTIHQLASRDGIDDPG